MTKDPKPPLRRLLVVDDDTELLTVMSDFLLGAGYEVVPATSQEEALTIAGRDDTIDLAMVDVRLGKADGVNLARELRSRHSWPIIVMSGHMGADVIVRAMREGAADFITKPFDPHILPVRLEKVLETDGIAREFQRLRAQFGERRRLESVVGADAKMVAIAKLVEEYAASTAPVLITGETGTGKELIAREIHKASQRASGPFVAVNCGAVPEELFEAEFFGHEKGAFTGASSAQIGRVEAAAGGTLFLDEIGTMSLRLQSKLLRVLQEREFERVGSHVARKAEFRLIAATNVDLEEEIQKKSFRQDFYYRLRVLPIHLPPLRERASDIPLLADHFLARIAAESGQPKKTISARAMRELTTYPWPGNVRELAAVLERAALTTSAAQILAFHLTSGVAEEIGSFAAASAANREAFERDYLQKLFVSTRGNLRLASRISCISRRHLQRMRARYGIALETFEDEPEE